MEMAHWDTEYTSTQTTYHKKQSKMKTVMSIKELNIMLKGMTTAILLDTPPEE